MLSCKLSMAPHHHSETSSHMLTAFFVDPDPDVGAYIAVRYDTVRSRIAAFCRRGRPSKTARLKHNSYLCDLMMRLDAEAQLLGEHMVAGRSYDLPIEDL